MELKQISRLRLDGICNREIDKTLNLSRNTIKDDVNFFQPATPL